MTLEKLVGNKYYQSIATLIVDKLSKLENLVIEDMFLVKLAKYLIEISFLKSESTA